MRRLAFANFLVLLLLASACFALEISTGKNAYTKGETLIVSGTNATEPVSIVITNDCRLLFSETVATNGGNFSKNFTITFLEPKGGWLINASSGGESAGASVTVTSPREASYYLVKLTSPPEGVAFERTEKMPISAYITDSGKPLKDAKVKAWVGCAPVLLAETGPGVYEYEYQLPVDGKAGDTQLYVTAEEGKTAKFGGENGVVFKVEKAAINVVFLSPTADAYNVGENIPIEVALNYPNGEAVEGANVSIKVGGAQVPVGLQASGAYRADYLVGAKDQGTLIISAEADDPYGNSGSASHDPISVGGWFEWFIWANMHYIIIGAVIIIASAAYVSIRARNQINEDALERKKIEITEMEKQLQTDYIKKGLLDRGTYERRMTEYEAQLTEIENRLKRGRRKK
ncbi:MAG: hypothetical protein NT157_06230 [Candidatus Micrarchaeota archaeon]|nr:hypothetical protein [Candidatus Micrarchaeota archaeon]